MRTLLVPLIGSLRDVKRHCPPLLLPLLLAVSIVGCSNVDFEKGNDGAGGAGPTATTPCSPLGGEFPSNTNGMYGHIIVQDPVTCGSSPYIKCDSHEEMNSGSQGMKISDIVVSAPLVPTRPFDVGFETRNGGMLKYPAGSGNLTGQPVVEFWGLKLRTKIALADGDLPGNYQFAVLADDGFRLTREDTGQVLLDIHGVNSTKLNVATVTVTFAAGQRIPFIVEYYQTPRTEIALGMLWRRNPTTLSEPQNGNQGQEYWFLWQQYDPATKMSPPTDEFYDLLSRDWKPMRTQNFWMPDNLVHTCVD